MFFLGSRFTRRPGFGKTGHIGSAPHPANSSGVADTSPAARHGAGSVKSEQMKVADEPRA